MQKTTFLRVAISALPLRVTGYSSSDHVKLVIPLIYVTGPEKTGLIYIKYTYSYYGAYLSFYTLYLHFVNFNEQLRNFCTCDKICINILCLE